MFCDVHPVALRVAYPAFGYSPKGVRYGCGLGRLLNVFDTFHLKAKMVNAPGLIRPTDQGYPHEAIRKIDSAIGAAVFFFQAKGLFIELGELIAVLDVERNMSDTGLIHHGPPWQ